MSVLFLHAECRMLGILFDFLEEDRSRREDAYGLNTYSLVQLGAGLFAVRLRLLLRLAAPGLRGAPVDVGCFAIELVRLAMVMMMVTMMMEWLTVAAGGGGHHDRVPSNCFSAALGFPPAL